MVRCTMHYVVYEIMPGEDRAYLDDESYPAGWYFQFARDSKRLTFWLPVGPFRSRALAEEAAEISTGRHAVMA